MKTALGIFELILSLRKNLTSLNFGDMLFSRKRIVSLNMIRSRSNTCSALTKLKINVTNFFDLLYLLDGRFYCLSTLIVSVTDHYGPADIHGIVSRISVFMLRAKKQEIKISTIHNFFVFVETIFDIEVFFPLWEPSHSYVYL